MVTIALKKIKYANIGKSAFRITQISSIKHSNLTLLVFWGESFTSTKNHDYPGGRIHIQHYKS